MEAEETAVSTQRYGRHIPATYEFKARIENLLKAVFSAVKGK
jgi:hypothetical protein